MGRAALRPFFPVLFAIGSLLGCGASTAVVPDAGPALEPRFDAGFVRCATVETTGLAPASARLSDASPPVAPDGGVIIAEGRYFLTSVTGYGGSLEFVEAVAASATSAMDLRAGIFRETFQDAYRQPVSGTYSTVNSETIVHEDCPLSATYGFHAIVTASGFDLVLDPPDIPVVVESFTRQ